MPRSEAESIEMELVLAAIHKRYGYDLGEYVPETIERRLENALARSGLSHFGELTHRLLHDPAWFAGLLDQLTVQVSDMFRDPNVYRTFREQVIPRLASYPEIKVWHAGCSTGEEAYATAILLSEENLYERAHIYATDVSATAIERAKEGVYGSQQALTFAENYELAGGTRDFSDYCISGYGRIAMRDCLRKNLVFFQHNLATDYAIGEVHVVFCRNVLIYFGKDLRRRVLDMLGQALCRGGFLCLGAAEAVPDEATSVFTAFAPAARIYRKVSGG